MPTKSTKSSSSKNSTAGSKSGYAKFAAEKKEIAAFKAKAKMAKKK